MQSYKPAVPSSVPPYGSVVPMAPVLVTASSARVVSVVYDSATESLEIQNENVTLGSGETLIWDFSNIPERWLPMIHFLDGERQGLGPFAALRQTESQIFGEGNIGAASARGECYGYRAVLHPPPDCDRTRLIESRPAQLLNHGAAASTPKVEIKVCLDALTFEVKPERFSCFHGDAIVFSFDGLPQGYAPAVVFERYRPLDDEAWQDSPHFGPFTTFCHEENEILASGSSGLVGTFRFIVTVVHLVDGDLVSQKLARSGDPVIDREEDPVYPAAEPEDG